MLRTDPKREPERKPFNARMTMEGYRLLRALAGKWGLSMTSVMELLVRQAAKKEGVE